MKFTQRFRYCFTSTLVRGPAVLLVVSLFFIACGSEPQQPASGRPAFAQPTFVFLDVTAAPALPTATPWPGLRDDGVRMIPEGLDPELYSRAEPGEVVGLWTRFLTGAAMQASSSNFFFRRRTRFEGELHLCPGGTGYLEGEPDGPVEWSVNTSAGAWYEVTLTHGIPLTGDTITFALGIYDGMPAPSGSSSVIEFTNSDRCALSQPGVQSASTAGERRLDTRPVLVAIEIEDIPWVGGHKEFPAALTLEGSQSLEQDMGVDYWSAYLSGGVLDAVLYNFSSRAVTLAFSGTLHLCDQRVAVLDGEPSGIGEWAVQSTGSKPNEVKIVFTLPGDPAFRTLVLGVSEGLPVRIGRNAGSGLIEARPLELGESDECGA